MCREGAWAQRPDVKKSEEAASVQTGQGKQSDRLLSFLLGLYAKER